MRGAFAKKKKKSSRWQISGGVFESVHYGREEKKGKSTEKGWRVPGNQVRTESKLG